MTEVTTSIWDVILGLVGLSPDRLTFCACGTVMVETVNEGGGLSTRCPRHPRPYFGPAPSLI